MKKKTLFALILMTLSFSGLCQQGISGNYGAVTPVTSDIPGSEAYQQQRQEQNAQEQQGTGSPSQPAPAPNTPGADERGEAAASSFEERMGQIVATSGSKADMCRALIHAHATAQPPVTPVPAQVVECQDLQRLSGGQLQAVNSRENTMQSLDGQIRCTMKASYTVDYEACEKATKMYDAVRVAEKAMDMQQALRADAKNKQLQAEAMQRAAQGDLQAGALDAAAAEQKHMKSLNTEKMVAYSAAVAALINAYRQIPGEKQALQECGQQPSCPNTVKNNRGAILANQNAKGALATAIAEFTAKGLAAGIAMGNNQKAVDTIEKAKQPYEEEQDDLMLERCQFNPADPACLTPGERVSGGSFAPGQFGLGDGNSNAFNLNPESGEFGEVGAETNLDDMNEVASINNPFAEDAKKANDILNPAGAAQAQATGGAAAGGMAGGGVGGGMGGGGASLGNDLAGADPEGDKEAQIKTGKVSGIYGAVGGGGYRGVASSKESANPFASLFDQKGSSGGTEVEGVAADIDGKTSELFQKISKRYSRVHADKRIEATNLE